MSFSEECCRNPQERERDREREREGGGEGEGGEAVYIVIHKCWAKIKRDLTCLEWCHSFSRLRSTGGGSKGWKGEERKRSLHCSQLLLTLRWASEEKEEGKGKGEIHIREPKQGRSLSSLDSTFDGGLIVAGTKEDHGFYSNVRGSMVQLLNGHRLREERKMCRFIPWQRFRWPTATTVFKR